MTDSFIGSYSALATPSLDSLTSQDRGVVDAFHTLCYERWRRDGWGTIDASWFGHRCLKTPLDLWVYQEIMVESRPDLVIETGTNFGGSGLFLATMLDLLGGGRVVSIDITRRPGLPEHPRLEYITGSSVADDVVAQVNSIAESHSRCMVVLDSDHGEAHVAAELRAYADLVSPDCYFIVEDTNIAGNPVFPDFPDGGPSAALAEFLAADERFEVDRSREHFLMSMSPGGFLRRTS